MIRIILAGVFSLLFPGIGQLFNSQWIKGISFIVVELGLLYLAPPELGIVMIYRLIWLLSILDASIVAYLVSKGRKELTVYKGWRAALIVGPALLITLPIAILPSFLPQLTFYLAVTQIEEEEGSEDQLQEEKRLYEEYLEETYKESFILGGESYNSNYGHYLIEASPESNPDIVFGVYQDHKEKIQDTYIDFLWEDEARKGLYPIVENLFEEIWVFDFNIAIKAGKKEQIMSENNQLIGFEEGRNLYPDDYNYMVELFVFEDYDNPERELEKLYEVISYFKEQNIQVALFAVKYYDERLLEKEGRDIKPGSQYKEYASHYISLNRIDINQIQSASDLEEHMVKLEKFYKGNQD